MKNVEQFLTIRNFDKHQHYKDRNPTWIKLYFALLNDRQFYRLSDASKFHLIGLFLIASQCDNKIPLDMPWIERQLAATETIDLAALIDSGFVELLEQPASKPLARSKQPATPEKRREEKSSETEETPISPQGGASDPPPQVPPRVLFDAYNEERGGLPEATVFTEERRRKSEARLRRHASDTGAFLANFRGSIRKARDIPFMLGARGWKASFDWFIANDLNHVKVLEGRYDDSKQQQQLESTGQRNARTTRENAERLLSRFDHETGGGVPGGPERGDLGGVPGGVRQVRTASAGTFGPAHDSGVEGSVEDAAVVIHS